MRALYKAARHQLYPPGNPCGPIRRRTGSLLQSALLSLLAQTGLAGEHPPPTSIDIHSPALIGLQQQIPLAGKQSKVRVAELWQQFQSARSLHYAINWSQPIEIYALYTGFDTTSPTIELIIGYRENLLLRETDRGSPWARQAIPAGNYLDYSSSPRTAGRENTSHSAAHQSHDGNVREGWKRLDTHRLPVAVMERYQVSPQGEFSNGRLFVLYAPDSQSQQPDS